VLRRLTSSPAPVRSPIISAEGRTVIYGEPFDVSRRRLRVMAADGTGDRLLFDAQPLGCLNMFRPAWNPKDQNVLVAPCVDERGTQSLQVLSLDGTVLKVLKTGLAAMGDVAYSRDGTQVIFWGSQDTTLDGGSIFVMDVDGDTPPVALTHGPAGADADPQWSPDGAHIVFRHRTSDGTDAGNLDLFVMNADGSDLRRLTDHPALDENPMWSPDGQRIVFRSLRSGASGSTPAAHLWIVNSDGTNLQELLVADDGTAESSVAWAHG
jgi:Tol biopolymer transport system component